MADTDTIGVSADFENNTEAIEAWDGVLFDRFVEFRDALVTGLGAHGNRALELYPPEPGERALDIGCGFGDTTRQLARLVGPDGEAVGVDASPRFIAASREEAAEEGVENVRYVVADVEAGLPEEVGDGFDRVFARMGTMFFANPVPAMRTIRAAMRPGALLTMVVWRQKATTSSCTTPSRSPSASSPIPIRPTSRPAARARSRWRTRTRPAGSCRPPASRTSR